MEKTAKLKIIDDVKLEPTLKEAQAFVGGYVEVSLCRTEIILSSMKKVNYKVYH